MVSLVLLVTFKSGEQINTEGFPLTWRLIGRGWRSDSWWWCVYVHTTYPWHAERCKFETLLLSFWREREREKQLQSWWSRLTYARNCLQWRSCEELAIWLLVSLLQFYATCNSCVVVKMIVPYKWMDQSWLQTAYNHSAATYMLN